MGKLGMTVVPACALILAAPAAANPPTRVQEHVDRTTTIPAGALCSFEFVVRSERYERPRPTPTRMEASTASRSISPAGTPPTRIPPTGTCSVSPSRAR